MQSHARVVVIGGGIGGLSALYHLTLEGWTDVVLLERNELTSGTSRRSCLPDQLPLRHRRHAPVDQPDSCG